MKDKNFLQWIHDRLHFVYKENLCFDYMYKLRAIIEAIPENQVTPNLVVSEKIERKLKTTLLGEPDMTENIVSLCNSCKKTECAKRREPNEILLTCKGYKPIEERLK